ncbi:MAG: DUF4190 domain-containing protein [Saprospiraceae bacterium]|nr:DUF4190 domain-containing protein [Saprospiraceae bacterium]MDZ4705575.1 DUF4190 domain-containing protein [Saprospiraceae bacterium]
MNQPILPFKFALPLVLLLLSVAAMAVNAPQTASESGKQPPKNLSMRQFSESSNAELEGLLGKKLSWKDRIVLKILKKKLRKAIQENPAFGEVPMGNHLLAPCSKITLHTGEIIEADVLQITATRVVYRRCGRPNTPEIDISKGDVVRIEGPDGELVFQDDGQDDPQYQNMGYERPETEEMAVWAFVCSLLGVVFFPLFIVGAVLGAISLGRIRRNPGKYKGKGLALAALIIGIAMVVLLIMVIAIFVTSFG